MPNETVIEKHTIGYVPPEDRHGKVRDLFTLWFGTNIAPLPVVTGAAGITVFNLNLFWCIIAIIVGHLVGGVFMALHSAQGPQMGIPQMIQSRGQFGSYGALIVVVIAAVMYLAFFASNIVLAGQSLHGIFDGVPISAGIILGALGSGLICVIGYRFIHALNKIGTVVLGVGIVVAIAAIFTRGVPDTSGLRVPSPRQASWRRSRSARCGRSLSRHMFRTTRGTCPPRSVFARPSSPPTWAAPSARSCRSRSALLWHWP